MMITYYLKKMNKSIRFYVRKNLEEKYGVLNHSIGDGRVGHVQARSILGRVYDHTKGARKKTGKSKESSL